MILINSSSKDALKIFQPFLPIFVPIGIGCLMAALKQEGIRASFVDEQVEDNPLGIISKRLKDMTPPYIFGFSVLSSALKSAFLLSRHLKKLYPDSLICFGGVHPTALPDEVLSYPHVDLVIRGEGEKPLVELYKCIKGGKDFTHIDNLSYKKNGEIIHNKRAPVLCDLDVFPPFPYHLFNPEKYDMGFVITSRGCPYECIFCSNRVTTGKKYRFKSAELILKELEIVHHKYKRNYILFIDDNFLVNKDRIYKLLEGIRNKGLHEKMTFNFQARGDNVDYKLLKSMYETGFRSIFFGIETSSEEIMKLIKKGETVEQCIEGVKICKDIGFHVSATFIYGFPTETHEDRMNCVRLSRALSLDMVRYNNVTPYPGTELYRMAKSDGRLNIEGMYENFNSVSTFIENPFNKIPFSYVPENNTEDEIRRDLLFSYFSFYLDYKRLTGIFMRPDQGVSWFNCGEKFFDIFMKLPPMVALFFMMFFKFVQLFYYTVLRKDTAISFSFFLKVFEGLYKK